MRIAPSIQVTEPARQQLTQWARGQRTPARLVLRTKSTSLAAEGHDNQHIATALDTSRQTVDQAGTGNYIVSLLVLLKNA
jgi:DNA-binding NarL/FixJ family response regulator